MSEPTCDRAALLWMADSLNAQARLILFMCLFTPMSADALKSYKATAEDFAEIAENIRAACGVVE